MFPPEQSAISKSSQSDQSASSQALIAGRSSKLDIIFPLYDHLYQVSHISSWILGIVAVFFYCQCVYAALWPRHEFWDSYSHDTLVGQVMYYCNYILMFQSRRIQRGGIEIAGRLQAQLLGGQIADCLAVHREVHGTGTRHNLDALTLEIVEAFGTDGLDLRDDDVRVVFGYGGRKGLAVQHVKDLARIGYLHGRCSGILVARNDGLAQTLGRNDELLAQFARAQKQYLFHLCGGFGFFDHKDRIFFH